MKFKNKSQQKKKRFEKSTIMTIAIAGIMILSSIGFMYIGGFGRDNPELSYKGINFVNINDQWQAKIDGRTLSFYYFPGDLEYINLSVGAVETIRNSGVVYMTFDPDETDQLIDLTRFEMAADLYEFGIMTQNGMTKASLTYSLPIITCNESNGTVLYFKESDNLSISKEGDCIVLEGSDYDFLRIKDRIKYALLGVMQ